MDVIEEVSEAARFQETMEELLHVHELFHYPFLMNRKIVIMYFETLVVLS